MKVMKTYVCTGCTTDDIGCVLQVPEDDFPPKHCPYDTDEGVDWQETYGFDEEYDEWIT